MHHPLSTAMQIPYLDITVDMTLMKSIPYMSVIMKSKDHLHGFTALRSTSGEQVETTNLPFHLCHVFMASQMTQFMFKLLNIYFSF